MVNIAPAWTTPVITVWPGTENPAGSRSVKPTMQTAETLVNKASNQLRDRPGATIIGSFKVAAPAAINPNQIIAAAMVVRSDFHITADGTCYKPEAVVARLQVQSGTVAET